MTARVEFTLDQRKRLAELLKERFTRDELRRLIDLSVRKGAWSDIAGGTWAAHAFNVLKWAEREGLQGELVVALLEAKPRLADLIDMAAELGLGPRIETQRRGKQPTVGAKDGLERTIENRLGLAVSATWHAKYGAAMHRVCRLSVGSGGGSGFLIGPRAVLTAHHVVEGSAPEEIEVFFDAFAYGHGRRVEVSRVALTSRVYEPERNATSGPGPTEQELDYALLLLEEDVGNEGVGASDAMRGWIELPSSAPALTSGAPIIVLQHPGQSEQKLAIDTDAWQGPTPDGLRMRYTTNTDPGTSGSPAFDWEWNLVALHHYGSASGGYNQGIPAWRIRDQVIDAGLGDEIDASGQADTVVQDDGSVGLEPDTNDPPTTTPDTAPRQRKESDLGRWIGIGVVVAGAIAFGVATIVDYLRPKCWQITAPTTALEKDNGPELLEGGERGRP